MDKTHCCINSMLGDKRMIPHIAGIIQHGTRATTIADILRMRGVNVSPYYKPDK